MSVFDVPVPGCIMSDSEKGPDPAMDVDREEDEIAAIKDEMKEKIKDEVRGSTNVITSSVGA